MLATLEAEQLDADDHAAVLAVRGDLDLAAAPRVRTAVGNLMGQGVRHLEVDLEGCTFIDSSGMAALLWAQHRLQALGGELVTVHAHGPPMRALEISGVDGVLAVRH